MTCFYRFYETTDTIIENYDWFPNKQTGKPLSLATREFLLFSKMFLSFLVILSVSYALPMRSMGLEKRIVEVRPTEEVVPETRFGGSHGSGGGADAPFHTPDHPSSPETFGEFKPPTFEPPKLTTPDTLTGSLSDKALVDALTMVNVPSGQSIALGGKTFTIKEQVLDGNSRHNAYSATDANGNPVTVKIYLSNSGIEKFDPAFSKKNREESFTNEVNALQKVTHHWVLSPMQKFQEPMCVIF